VEDRFVTIQEAYKSTGVSRSSIYHHCDNGVFLTKKAKKGTKLVRLRDVEAYSNTFGFGDAVDQKVMLLREEVEEKISKVEEEMEATSNLVNEFIAIAQLYDPKLSDPLFKELKNKGEGYKTILSAAVSELTFTSWDDNKINVWATLMKSITEVDLQRMLEVGLQNPWVPLLKLNLSMASFLSSKPSFHQSLVAKNLSTKLDTGRRNIRSAIALINMANRKSNTYAKRMSQLLVETRTIGDAMDDFVIHHYKDNSLRALF